MANDGLSLDLPLPDQCRDSTDVLAVSVPQKSEALTRAIGRLPDAHMIEVAQPKPMDDETATADVTRYLAKDVEIRTIANADTEDTETIDGRRTDQANRSRW